jgi:hypothetical protein
MVSDPLKEEEIAEIERLLVKSKDLDKEVKEALSRLIASHRLIYLRKKVFNQHIEKYIQSY